MREIFHPWISVVSFKIISGFVCLILQKQNAESDWHDFCHLLLLDLKQSRCFIGMDNVARDSILSPNF